MTPAPAHLDNPPEPVTGKILDAAVARAREIERDLTAGRLTVPYPAAIRLDLVACLQVFSAWATTPERLAYLAGRLDQAELPW